MTINNSFSVSHSPAALIPLITPVMSHETLLQFPAGQHTWQELPHINSWQCVSVI